MSATQSRQEDLRLITGQGRYTADHSAAGLLHAWVIRSPVACGQITHLDLSSVAAAPGVRWVMTAQDVSALGGRDLPSVVSLPDQVVVTMPVLARGEVQFVGQPIALVIAESAAQAQNAAERAVLDITERAALIDPHKALAPGAPLLHAQAPDNLSLVYQSGDGAAVTQALATAAHVSSLTVRSQRLIGAPMEPRAVIVDYDSALDRVRVTTPSQGVMGMTRALAAATGLSPEQLDVRSPEVGGSFGLRAGPYSEHAALVLAARHLKTAIRWVGSRSESMLSDWQGRAITLAGTMGLDAQGHIVALQLDALVDLGAYNGYVSTLVGTRNLAATAGGVYKVPALALRSRLVFTNTVPTSAYRGAGRPDVAYAIEALIEHAAHTHGFDPIDLRRRNFIAPADFPYVSANGTRYDACAFDRVLDRALALADHAGFEIRRQASAKRGRLRGLGLACYVEATGGGAVPQDLVEGAFDDTGHLVIYGVTGASGQGHATSFAALVEMELGLPAKRVCYLAGHHERRLLANGTEGSRTLYGAGSAVVDLCRTLRVKAQALWTEGGGQGPIDWLRWLPTLDEGQLDRLKAQGLAQSGVTFPNGCHIAEIEIDARTGQTQVLSYIAVDDVGRVISPAQVHGQLQGGVVQGWGQVFGEHVHYDDQGQLLTGSFMDYALPHIGCMPALRSECIELPTTLNLVGAKGAGEAGCTGSVPALYNAVMSVLRPRGIVHLDLPFTPARLWAALNPE